MFKSQATLPTDIEKLRQACQQVLEADQKATRGIWTAERRHVHVPTIHGYMWCGFGTDKEAANHMEMAAISRNLSPIMARLLLKQCQEWKAYLHSSHRAPHRRSET